MFDELVRQRDALVAMLPGSFVKGFDLSGNPVDSLGRRKRSSWKERLKIPGSKPGTGAYRRGRGRGTVISFKPSRSGKHRRTVLFGSNVSYQRWTGKGWKEHDVG